MFILECTEETFEELVINSDLPVVVDFYADWCGPCKMIKPHLEKLAEKYKDTVRFVMINSDECQDLVSDYGVRSLPTIKFFTRQSIIDDTIVGTTSPAKIEEKIIKLIGA